jgi:hypothetical protein
MDKKSQEEVLSGKGALDALGFDQASMPNPSPTPAMSSDDFSKLVPPIAPRGYNPIKVALYDEGGVEIDKDRVFLPSFDSDEVLCKNCKYGLIMKSLHPGNRRVDGTPFTYSVGFCNAGPEQVQLDDFRPVECSGFKAKKNKGRK